MKVLFTASVNDRETDLTQVMKTTNPQVLLEALEEQDHHVPTVEVLLKHLFITHAAYVERDYVITITFKMEEE